MSTQKDNPGTIEKVVERDVETGERSLLYVAATRAKKR